MSLDDIPENSNFNAEEDIQSLVAPYFRKLVKQNFIARGTSYLHYMAPLPRMYLIACLGILSYNFCKALENNETFKKLLDGIGNISIADTNVQYRRSARIVFGRSLHDYVPLYIGIHTPMQYVVTRDNFEEQAWRVVFAEISVEKVFDLDGVCYTDGNAASDASQVYMNLEGIDAIDWDIVLRESRTWSPEWKRRKAAEVLVPDRVPPECIDRYVLMTKEVADQFRTEITNLIRNDFIDHTDFEVVHDSRYFYSLHGGRLIPNG
jgi:hypothetical protein